MNARDPLVTVLMPVYNAGVFLRPTLETILRQTYRDFEFLIINDCSTDDSLETIRSFGDPRIRVHTNPVNMGQTKSLNVGLRLARGKYVVVNDADDYSLPRRIETQLDFIIKNPEYPVVGTSCYIMDREGQIMRTFLRPTDPREIQMQFLSDTPMTHGSVIMQKDAILAMGGYNEEFRIIQDYELWSTLMRKGSRVMNIPEILVVIRTFADSISFKERDAQTLENGKTIQANVEAMTGLTISLDEAVRQRHFFVAPERLSREEFEQAERLFTREYEGLRTEIHPGETYLREDLASRLLKPYVKLAISRFQDGKPGEARGITATYMRKYGRKKLPLLVWTLSFLGASSLGHAIRFYERRQKAAARKSYPLHAKGN
jgi:glycosyltransferase involved in cell wall biosynthesis